MIGLRNPMGMAIDKDGNVAVSNYDHNTVTRYSPAGEYLGVFINSGLTNPIALAYDSSGNMFVANMKGDSITKYTPAGGYLGIFASSNLFGPRGLAFDAMGNLFVGNNLGNTITNTAFSGFGQPMDFKVDSTGDIWVLDEGAGLEGPFFPRPMGTGFSGLEAPDYSSPVAVTQRSLTV
jgi:DNA-binding beta-propeller fold protein YncE